MIKPTPTRAFAAYNPFAPRAIRLCVGIVSCFRCNKKLYKNHLQAGWQWQTCEHGRCDTEWWSLALPHECFGGYLAAIMGEHSAEKIILNCWPKLATLTRPQLWHEPLASGSEPHWVQIAVRPRERHLYRTAKIPEFLHILLRDAA